MGKHDWYRNLTWNAAIEAAFYDRLGRARRKAQYLRIQSGYLTQSYPEVSLKLLDQYFALGDRFDFSMAYIQQANALKTLGNLKGAANSFFEAVKVEEDRPKVTTAAPIYFAHFVAEARLSDLYLCALDVLDKNRCPIVLPLQKYLACGSRALLLEELGRHDEAITAAELAMDAAQARSSGFHYHQSAGLVNKTDDEFGERVALLAKRRTS